MQIVHEGRPLTFGDTKVAMRVAHRPARVLLRAAGRPADHLGNEVLEACRGDPVVRLVHRRVLIQPVIIHDAVDEVVDDRGDVVNPAEPVVKRGTLVRLHGTPKGPRGDTLAGCRVIRPGAARTVTT